MKRQILNQLLADQAAKQAVALVTMLASGDQRLIYPDSDPQPDADIDAIAKQALRNNHSGCQDTAAGPVFIQVFNPPLRLIIVGAVHIAQALVSVARISDYEVIVIDPRHAWTSAARFPDVTIDSQWPDAALERLQPDSRTAIVTLSHDPKLDDPALHIALRSAAFYIGSLGSRKTHSARLERLQTGGFSEAELTRIHGPIGLNLGARSPAEIAIAIMAEIIQTLHQART